LSRADPPVRVPYGVGLLVKVPSVNVLVPDFSVTGEEGKEIENVKLVEPVTVKDAAETVPVFTGIVTPPVELLVPAGVKVTVPKEVPTATFPKFISTVLVMVKGAIRVIEAVASAETWALV
jgi:hypothetical protein